MGTRLALISNLLRSSFASGHAQNEADDSENHDCASDLLRRNQIQLTENMIKTTLILTVMSLLALNTKADTQEQLAACRQQIDSLDQRIVDLIQQRARVVKEVGEIKRAAHLPVTVPSREQQVVEKAQALAQAGPLPAEAVGRIYQKLVEEMRDWETKLDVATP
jgi:chorismate mutase